MIRDRLVVGIRDKAISEKLQLEADLTLARAKVIVCQREAVHEQQVLKRDSRSLAVDVVKDSTNVRHVQLRMSHAIGVKGLGIIVHTVFQLEQWATYTQISEAMSSSQPFLELSLQLMVQAMHDVKDVREDGAIQARHRSRS